jgi:predicted lipid-binding transport protein (Tim44 family)
MRRFLVLAVIFTFLTTFTLEEAFARAGGGKSSGSRGSRSYSAPAKPYQAPSSPSQVQRGQQSIPQTQAAQPSRWGGFMGMLAGGILGGIIGNMLFSSFAHGAGAGGYGGPGLFDLILIGLIIFVIYKIVSSRRKAQQPVYAGGYQQYSGLERPQEVPVYDTTASAIEDTQRGLSHIRQFDPAFDGRQFKEAVTDIFFKVQAAWTNRSMEPVKNLLTPEMFGIMSKETETLRIEKRVNRLENIALRNLEITEAWQEGGKDFITVEINANVIDYVTDEAGRVIEGSNTDPVRFVEYWTFTRPVGSNQWQLCAIQQA